MSTEELLKPRYKGWIYKILCSRNNKFYIGSTQNIIKRKSEHFVKLKRGTHHSKHLQNSYNKYGAQAIIFEVVEEFWFYSKEELLNKEQKYLDELKPKFNTYSIAGSPLGFKRGAHSEESKTKMSKAKKGIKFTDDHKINMIASQSKRDLSSRNITGLVRFMPGDKNHAARKVVDEKTGKIFLTLTDASNECGVKIGYLSGMLNGHFKNKTTLKFYDNRRINAPTL